MGIAFGLVLADKWGEEAGGIAVLGVFAFICFAASWELNSDSDVIPAIEVYRGNTDLIISYKDTIPVDSVVVYKNKLWIIQKKYNM